MRATGRINAVQAMTYGLGGKLADGMGHVLCWEFDRASQFPDAGGKCVTVHWVSALHTQRSQLIGDTVSRRVHASNREHQVGVNVDREHLLWQLGDRR